MPALRIGPVAHPAVSLVDLLLYREGLTPPRQPPNGHSRRRDPWLALGLGAI
jgi:hypothetical protein